MTTTANGAGTATDTASEPGTPAHAGSGTGTDTRIDAGAYEVLRDRLAARGGELALRTEALNSRRTESFGSTELRLTGTGHVRTPHASVPRDIVAVGDALLFGHTVDSTTAGRGNEITVSDVFALHDRALGPLPEDAIPGLLNDPAFVRELGALFRYYRDARLLQLRHLGGRLLAVFRTGEKAGDIRVLRWALRTDGTAQFLDARGDRDHVFPPSHDMEWTAATRDDHILGRHPHIRVGGEVYVSTVGGSLTLKADDDTETAEGIHSEPVTEPLQSLADADVAHARVGPLLLLRVRPYKEDGWRHLVLNTLTGKVTRLDGIGRSCRRLPEDQGIVFPGGYYLVATDTAKTFDTDAGEGSAGDLEFERAVSSPNGEDVLYVFQDRAEGRTLLLPYNVIRKEAAAPLTGSGYAVFDDGTLMTLRAATEPARVHPLQLWHSPYVSDTYAATRPAGTGPLARVGNADLVRGIADCLSIARAVAATTAPTATPTTAAYASLATACARAADRHHWLTDPELDAPHDLLAEIGATAEQVLGEFETVRTLTKQAADALTESAARVTALVRRVRGEAPRSAADWVDRLTGLRRAQGHLVTLKEMRYADTDRIDSLVAATEDDIDAAARRAVAFLGREDAFTGHRAEVERLTADAAAITTVAEAVPVADRLREHAAGLRTVTDVVTGLDIGDTVVRTSVLERVADVLGGVNRARATLEARRSELLDHEGRAEFAAEFALLGQAVTGALAAADTPETCDEQLASLLLQLEDLESRFVEYEGFLAELEAKRTEVYEAFAARRQSLQDARARRAERLAESAERVLGSITRRLSSLADTDAVNTYFASDPMVAKVRRTAGELRELGDRVRAEELDGRLTSARQEAARALRDRTDLYADGGATIRLGRHTFAVNTRTPELTLVPHGDRTALALTGTDYRAPVTDPAFEATRPYWNQLLPSESPEVYRAEHLAARLLAEHGAAGLRDADDLPALVRSAAEAAYDEGHQRGVHDHDATALLTALLRLHDEAGPLRHPSAARAAAQLLWAHGVRARSREDWTRRAVSLARVRETFGPAVGIDAFRTEVASAVRDFGAHGTDSGAVTDAGTHAVPDADPLHVADYLFEELTSGPPGFVTGAAARALLDGFHRSPGGPAFTEDLKQAQDDSLAARRQLVEAWLTSYSAASGVRADAGDLAEAVAVALCPELDRYDSTADLTAEVDGLLGSHPRVTGRRMTVRIDELLLRTRNFREHTVPGFRAYQRQRTALVTGERARLRLDEFRPRVMSSFVRNRLIDEVYLPLIGDNLAKQLGTSDDSRRTDTNGLLLLVSPPGYGKTTLMEYVADRLGLLLVKVDGPALGHAVTSLDPAEAPNATARQEVEKINFALAAGSNTLLYLDDIQHTSPELLQKFIALCDAQRRIEGVWEGEARTYDLRGKRFAVCMAGNPYTGTGGRFRVPDMLANRADVWNLGDVLTGKEDVFALSFVENALTSNPVLAPLAGRDRRDLDVLVRLADGVPGATSEALVHPYAPAELDRVLAVLRHLLTARRTVLAVNEAYIASAARTDESRTAPPFRLQGSYRNMNKIAARIDPVMNDAELSAVIDDHYAGEAQTLTTGAEANLLRLAELRSSLTPEQADRWAEIKAAYVRRQSLGGPEGDPLTRAVAALGLLADRVAAVESAITRAARRARPAIPSGDPSGD
ncbi:DNA repair ATPase [Streptomyces sp. IB2014 016-6]|uniref:DNA repair ATPase n=1 Tax=Streptomyces sp. IB2014 016-6 TaxID=2517818 RepID=UPI0011CBF9E7|nr:DNA repair ATPase [Streptomyces sp. IB2014 016-6]TXL90472.1 DNA repair ATPase [Streptomyces sp. IB2014 016-6]